MKIKFWQNQKGVSLIEATVAMALTSAAGVAYMTHVQTVAKNEAKQKVRASLTMLESQAMDYLKSKDVCNENMNKAFDGLSLTGDKVTGHDFHKALVGKSFVNGSGVKENKEIFKVDTSYDGDRLWVTDVNYELSGLQDRVIPNSPWNKTANLKIEVVFEMCANGGAVYRPITGGGKVPVCDQIVKQSKIFKKDAAFKVDGAGKIAQKSGKIWNPATQKYDVTGAMVNQAACADSQDALVEEAKDYADSKACLLKAYVMSSQGTSGSAGCDLSVQVQDTPVDITTSRSFTFPNEAIQAPSDVFVVGGGGGGGSAGTSKIGRGGGAGAVVSDTISVSKGLTCSVVIGAGGNGGGGGGGETKLTCQSRVITAAGGGGGENKAYTPNDDRCGLNGAASELPGSIGGSRGCRRQDGSAGYLGGGGGGGGDRNGNGGQGGSGVVRMTYKTALVKDNEGNEVDLDKSLEMGSFQYKSDRNPAADQAPNPSKVRSSLTCRRYKDDPLNRVPERCLENDAD